MNTLKFRTRIGKRWYYWGFINNGYGDFEFRGIPNTNEESLTQMEKMKRSQPSIEIQDKRRKEIYTGDIVRYIVDNETMVGEITYEPFFYSFALVNNKGRFLLPDLGIFTIGDKNGRYAPALEIIGNTKDNPTLVKW